MRVSFVLPGWPREPVGGYKVAYQYANHLARAGHSVTVLHAKTFSGQPVPVSSGGQLKYLLSVGAVAQDLRAVVTDAPPRWYPLDERVRVVNRLRGQESDLSDSDVVVATGVTTADFVAGVCASTGAAGAYFIQHFEDWTFPAEVVEATWRLPLRKIVIAPWLADIADRLGVDSALVPNAIDAEEFSRGPAVADRPVAVAAMVSPVAFKRADLLAKMFVDVHEAIPSVECLAFGVAPRPASLPEHVRYLQQPSRDRLSAIYRDARVYVCASDAEGWHLPPAEATLSGAAVVSTDISGVRVYASDFARFVPPGDGEALSEAVIATLRDEQTNSAMAERGYAALSSYTLDDAGRAFEEQLVAAVEDRS